MYRLQLDLFQFPVAYNTALRVTMTWMTGILQQHYQVLVQDPWIILHLIQMI